MKTVPNQRVIKVKKSPTDKQHLYTTNNLQAVFEAMHNLKQLCSFKLYMYLAKNQQDYELALSSKDFCDCANCSMTAYTTAFAELVEKGYLLQQGEGNKYIFIDMTANAELIKEETKANDIDTRTFEEIWGISRQEPKEIKQKIDLENWKPKVEIVNIPAEQISGSRRNQLEDVKKSNEKPKLWTF